MTATDWIAIAAGAALIGWINWYFFLAGTAAVTLTASTGIQAVPVVVESGYQPANIRVTAGTPVRLLFDRRESSPCSEQVVLPDFGTTRYLPAHQVTAVEFLPTTPGTYEFTCGMSMLRGRITVSQPEGR